MGIVRKLAGFFVVLVLIFSALSSNAQETDTTIVERNGRKFHQHIVVPGNTMYAISKKYGVSVKDIEEFNPKAKNGLAIGDTLFIIAISEDKVVQEKRMEVDGNIIVHEVQKGQTLYAISKMYDLPISELLLWNPELKDGVKEGMFIKIPVARLKKQAPPSEETVEDEEGIRHKVKPKETLYSLSSFYKVHIDSIVKANNGLPEGLKEGSEIIIPIQLDDGMMNQDTTQMKTRYRVGLLLPFFLDENDTLLSRLKLNDKETVLTKSLISLQFYEGVKLAFDSLTSAGMNFQLQVIETANDSALIGQMITSGRLEHLDLIIGPLYYSSFQQVAAYAREKKIHVVCPVPQNNRILLGNPYVSKVATSKNILYSELAAYLCEYFRSQNIILINKNFRVNALIDQFKTDYRRELELLNDTARYGKNVKELRWDDGAIDGLVANFSDSAINIIIIPSTDQVYVTDLLSKLNHIHDKFDFRVIGVDSWLKYTNVDFEYFENLHVMIPVEGHVNYDLPATKRFIRRYHEAYNGFPEKYAFLGYDITMYYLKLLNEAGTRIEPLLEKRRETYNYLSFDFFKTGIESGYENSNMVLVRYSNFQLEKIPMIR